jgi:hypothetical protein
MIGKTQPAPRRAAVQRILYVLLSLAALISVLRGVQNAVLHSQDMQWSPLVVFWQTSLDPYQVLLQDPHTPRYILSQGPNNLHLLFFVLAPLGFVTFEAAKLIWASANLVFLAATLWIFYRDKTIRMPIVVALVFLCAMPTRNALGNGQLSLFCLFFFALYLIFADRRPLLAAMFASIGAAKYSLGVPLFFQMRLTPLNVIAFGAIPFAAVVYWCLHFHLGFFEALFLPIQVASFTVGPRVGVGDFLMLVRGAGLAPLAADGVVAAVLLITVLMQRAFLATEDRLLNFAFYAMLSLWLVYHGSYDFVFLLPVAIVAMRSRSGIIRSGLIAGTAYFWFVTKELQDVFSIVPPLEFNLAVLMLMQALVAWEARMNAAAVKPAIEVRALGA